MAWHCQGTSRRRLSRHIARAEHDASNVESEQTRQVNFVLPPRAGKIGVVATSTSAGSVNLATLDNQAVDISTADTTQTGTQDCYVTFVADGQDAYVNFGPAQANVTGANAPVIATTGVNAASGAFKLPANVPSHFRITASDIWMGYIAGAAGTLRFYRSSPYPKAC